MAENERRRNQQLLERAVKALTKHGFGALWVETEEEARDRVLEMIPQEALVGVGGSRTIRQMGLVEVLLARGNRVADHWKAGLSDEERMAIRRQQLNCDVFLASSNAITLDGFLVNIDGAGNRVAGMIIGAPMVIIVAGVNKLARNVADGLERVRNVAAPLRAQSLGRDTPCAHTGLCSDCDTADRICGIVTIIERRLSYTDLRVILVNQLLGF
jgi:L-lactate utilization protein LutB